MVPKVYDLTKTPIDQGLVPRSYDLIVGLHVLHTVPDVRSCVTALNSLLIPGGCLLIVELDGTSWEDTPGSLWLDSIFGSFTEWFTYNDGRTHCTMTPPQWKEMLEQTNFSHVHTSTEDGGGIDVLLTAQKVAEQSSDIRDPSSIDLRDIFEYQRGTEMELQVRLRDLNLQDRSFFYLLVMDGPDADAALGLTATLGREFYPLDVRLAIFESQDELSNHLALLAQHAEIYDRGDKVVYFPRDGIPRVSRVVLSPPPHDVPDENLGSPEIGKIPYVDNEEYVTVEIITRSNAIVSLEGFTGRVITSNHPTVSQGQLVTGLNQTPGELVAIVHVGSVVLLDESQPYPSLTGHALPMTLVSMVISPFRLIPHVSTSPAQVVVAIADQGLSRMVTHYLRTIPRIDVAEVDFTDSGSLRSVDVVLTDSLTIAHCPHLRQWVPRSGKFLMWDTLLHQYFKEDPWRIGYALDTGLKLIPRLQEAEKYLHTPDALTVPLRAESSYAHPRQLFQAGKVYVLLGGLGGLGVDLAVWMYQVILLFSKVCNSLTSHLQHGARNLVLTSRRGIASLDSTTDGYSLAKLSYLRRLKNLNLRLERCDASSAQAMASLVQSFSLPIGGCFQLTLVLSDALFLDQTEDSFRLVHESKLTVFEIFASQVDIKCLDFFVAFSSISGLCGFLGQSNYSRRA